MRGVCESFPGINIVVETGKQTGAEIWCLVLLCWEQIHQIVRVTVQL